MALVRCTCLVDLVLDPGQASLDVQVLDPECGYVVHRLAAEPAGREVDRLRS